MNLRAYANGMTQAINPNVPMNVRVSSGYAVAADGRPAPAYQTPGEFVGSITDNVMIVTSVVSGYLAGGQSLRGDAISQGTLIVAQVLGTPGGAGTYLVNTKQSAASGSIYTDCVLQGNVQPLTWKDMQFIDGLNLQGTPSKIYLYGMINGIVRSDKKGGDLIIAPSGKTYLITNVVEQWPPIDFAPPPIGGSGAIGIGGAGTIVIGGIPYSWRATAGWCAVIGTMQNG